MALAGMCWPQVVIVDCSAGSDLWPGVVRTGREVVRAALGHAAITRKYVLYIIK